MATELAKAYVQIVPSAQGIQGSIGRAIGGEADSAGAAAGQGFGNKMMGALKGIIVAAGIGKMFSAAISEGAELEQSLGGIETLFKDSAEKVKQNAAEAYRTAGMSANEYMELTTSFSASLLQSLAGDTSAAADTADMAMTDMSDNANKMGTNMEDIKNAYQGFAKQNYTMLDNLKLGYGGTKTEMERLLADAQKITGVKYDIDSLGDVYNAIHVIQGGVDELNGGLGDVNKGLGITGTTAKEAASTISGSMTSMKSAFKNVLGQLTLGQDVGDSLNALTDTTMTFLFGNLMPAIGNVFKAIPQVITTALSASVRSMSLIGDNASAIVDQGVQFVGSFLKGVISEAPYLIEGIVKIVTSLGKALLEYDWGGTIQDLVGSIQENLDVAAGEILGADGNIVAAVLNAIATNIPQLLQGGVAMVNGLITGIFTALPLIFQTALEIITSLVNTMIENYPQYIKAGTDILMALIDGVRLALPQMLVAAAEAILSMATGLINNFPQILSAGFDMMASLITGVGNALPGIMGAAVEIAGMIFDTVLKTDWLQLGKDIISGMINGIGAMGGALWDAAVNVAKAALDAIKDFFGIASPSKVMRDQVGRWIPAGIAQGIENNTRPVTDAMEDLRNIAADGIGSDLALTLRQERQQMDSKELGGYHQGQAKSYMQNINIYQPVATPDETARAIRLQTTYGLAGDDE